jgi:hypothetical protein
MGHSKGSPMGKFIAMSPYIKNTERSHANKLMVYIKLLEKQEQAKPKRSRREIKNKGQN